MCQPEFPALGMVMKETDEGSVLWECVFQGGVADYKQVNEK